MNFRHFDYSLRFTHTVVTNKSSDYVTNSMMVPVGGGHYLIKVKGSGALWQGSSTEIEQNL